MEKHKIHREADADRASAVESADATGMIAGEALITQAELDHPEAFEPEHKKKKDD